MKIYSFFDVNEFIICLGYKGDLLRNELNKLAKNEKWKINYVNTGLNTMTGGRIKKVKKYLKNEKFFCLSYGDGLCDINIKKLIKFHITKNKIATLTAVKYKNPKGILKINSTQKISAIKEKPIEYINGGFFVLSKKIFKYLKNDKTIFEKDCLPKLAKINQLLAYKHHGYWACMDTIREKNELNKIWKSKKRGWKVWNR